MATAPHQNFPISVQRSALSRQKNRCASCGTRVSDIGAAGSSTHAYGEGARAHHLIPHKMNGPLTLENCVILCAACHLNVHQGGRWSDIAIYDDIKILPVNIQISKIAPLYRYYRG